MELDGIGFLLEQQIKLRIHSTVREQINKHSKIMFEMSFVVKCETAVAESIKLMKINGHEMEFSAARLEPVPSLDITDS